MRKLTIFLLAIFLVISCSEPDSKAPESELTVNNISSDMSNEYEIDESSTVTLLNLEEGALYGIFPSSSESARSVRSTDNPSLTKTNSGSFLHVANGTSFSFKGSDIGIGNSGNVRFIKYNLKSRGKIVTYELQPTDESLTFMAL